MMLQIKQEAKGCPSSKVNSVIALQPRTTPAFGFLVPIKHNDG